MTSKINKNKILLVEGRDEINFFDALLKSCTLDTIQVIESKGKD